jgi:SP family myo-inositol transporter-like MFS transporter 13
MSDDASDSNSIDDIGAGWFVWLVAFTASIAGSLFGYDTGRVRLRIIHIL